MQSGTRPGELSANDLPQPLVANGIYWMLNECRAARDQKDFAEDLSLKSIQIHSDPAIFFAPGVGQCQTFSKSLTVKSKKKRAQADPRI